jgi:hypothetical protein
MKRYFSISGIMNLPASAGSYSVELHLAGICQQASCDCVRASECDRLITPGLAVIINRASYAAASTKVLSPASHCSKQVRH